MYKNDQLSDFDIIINGRQIRAHKLVLSCRIPYFRSLFNICPLQETSEMSKAPINSEILEIILEWAYTNKISSNANILMEDVLKASDFLQIPTLKYKCGQMIIEENGNTPTLEKCILLLQLADRSCCVNLREYAMTKMIPSQEQLIDSTQFSFLTETNPTLALDTLKFFCKSPHKNQRKRAAI